jgi:endonuclease YncB( thermonuclease family)
MGQCINLSACGSNCISLNACNETNYEDNIEKENMEMLSKVNDSNVPLFTLEKHIVKAKIVRVYDGDTCFAVFKLHNDYVKFKIRMEGYDSPEIKPSLDISNREKVKKEAQQSKEALEKHVLHKIVTLHCGKWDKYGRLLGTIYVDDDRINVNQYMINNGFGYTYDGGTKKLWVDTSAD